MALSNRALLEVSRLSNEARSLARGTGAQRKEADVLLAKIAAINNAGVSPDEARERSLNQLMKELGMPEVDYEELRKQKLYEAAFRRFITGGSLHESEMEARDLAAGSQSISYTEGSAGGYLVPQSVYDTLILGMSLVTPLLDPSVVTIKSANDDIAPKDARPGTKQTVQGQGLSQLRPIAIPAWDTTQVSATRIGENTQNTKSSPMTAHVTALNSYAYRTSDVAVPFEFEEDSFQDVMEQLTACFSIGLARGVGADLQYGTGSSEPTGLITAAQDSGITIAASSVSINNLEDVLFSVDRVHRAHPKAAWVMDDGAWKAIRKNAPSASRPLSFSEGEATTRIRTAPVTCSASPSTSTTTSSAQTARRHRRTSCSATCRGSWCGCPAAFASSATSNRFTSPTARLSTRLSCVRTATSSQPAMNRSSRLASRRKNFGAGGNTGSPGAAE